MQGLTSKHLQGITFRLFLLATDDLSIDFYQLILFKKSFFADLNHFNVICFAELHA